MEDFPINIFTVFSSYDMSYLNLLKIASHARMNTRLIEPEKYQAGCNNEER